MTQTEVEEMRIFITGVACVGKTTIGREFADLIDVNFFDLDFEVEKFFGTCRFEGRYLGPGLQAGCSLREGGRRSIGEVTKEESKRPTKSIDPAW
jgi:hypothetical protein